MLFIQVSPVMIEKLKEVLEPYGVFLEPDGTGIVDGELADLWTLMDGEGNLAEKAEQ